MERDGLTTPAEGGGGDLRDVPRLEKACRDCFISRGEGAFVRRRRGGATQQFSLSSPVELPKRHFGVFWCPAILLKAARGREKFLPGGRRQGEKSTFGGIIVEGGRLDRAGADRKLRKMSKLSGIQLRVSPKGLEGLLSSS